MPYAAQLVESVVQQVIVGDVEWASSRIGGDWHPASADVSVGYSFVDGEFRPPATFASWQWNGSTWVAPLPEPDADEEHVAVWDEEAGEWTVVEVPQDEDE